MLTVLRRNKQSKLIKILLLMIAVSFLIGFGAMGYVRRSMRNQGADNPNAWVAKINGETISVMNLMRAERVMEGLYRQQLGDMADTLLAQVDLSGQALNQLVTEHVMNVLASNMGLAVTDAEVADVIYRQPVFQVSGRFDRNRYVQALRRQRLTPPEYEATLRRDLLADKLRNLVISSTKVADSDVYQEFLNREDKVNLRFVKLTPEKLAAQVSFTDEQVKEYFAATKEKFKLPEQRKVNYVSFRTDDYNDKITITDAQVKAYYDAHKEKDFQQPEQVLARHILIKAEAAADQAVKDAAKLKAEGLRKQLAGGADFAALAKAHSDDPGSKDKGGDLGWFGRERMVKAFEDAAFALKPGELSEVVESPFGYHIIQVQEKRDARTLPVEDVKDRIVNVLKRQEGLTLAKADAAAFREKAKGGEDLLKLGSTQGLKVGSSSTFTATQAIPGIAKGLEASKKAFAMKPNEVSEPFEAPTSVYLFQLTNVIEAHVPEFVEVENKVREEYRTHLEQQALAEKAKSLIVALQAGQSIDKVAAAEKLEAQETGLFARGVSSVPKVGASPSLIRDAFAAGTDKPVLPGSYKSGNGVIVAVVIARQAAAEADFAAKKDEIRDDLVEKKAQLTLQAWVEQTEKTMTIERNEELLADLRNSRGQAAAPRPTRAVPQQPQPMPVPDEEE
jgi:peptidyl-prolyl cis-trans isomerase D